MKRNKMMKDIPTKGDRIVYSWIPQGYEVDAPIAGMAWKPEINETKVCEITGFQKRENETGEYLVFTAIDLQTGEPFSFIPGGLVSYLAEQDHIKTGDKLALRYKGKKTLANGFTANDWDIVRLK